MPARHPETVRPLPWMPRPGSFALAVVVFTAVGCTRATRNPDVSPSGANVVDIVSRGLHFDAPDVIPAGWTTFRFRNETGGTHFVALERMPLVEGAQKTLEDSKAEVVPVFQNIMDSLAGVPLSSPGSGLAVPEWYGSVVLMGGPGLVAPGRTAETSVYLEPGTYVIECYVKDNGVFHSMAGMIAQIVVTDETSRAPEPSPSLRVTVSSTRGIEIDGPLEPGRHSVAVHFPDQTAYSHFLGHDVHLARIDARVELDALAAWMNWSVPGELETPAPAEFLGGVQDMPAGSTAYFDVLLEPGDYAFIAEVPDPAGKGMLRTFTVPAELPVRPES